MGTVTSTTTTVPAGSAFELPRHPIVGDLFTLIQIGESTTLYVYDGCRWLLTNGHNWSPSNNITEAFEAYDRAMGVL